MAGEQNSSSVRKRRFWTRFLVWSLIANIAIPLIWGFIDPELCSGRTVWLTSLSVLPITVAIGIVGLAARSSTAGRVAAGFGMVVWLGMWFAWFEALRITAATMPFNCF